MNEAFMDKPIKKPKTRRWFRFSLRTLLILFTILSIVGGWVAWELYQIRQESEVVVWIKEMDGQVGVRFDGRPTAVFIGKDATEISRLEELNLLRILSLYNTQVSDLAPLANLSHLKELDLHNSPAQDLTPLANLKQIDWIDLSSTNVSDLSPLSELRTLRVLAIENTSVRTLSPLKQLKKLETLYLFGTDINDGQIQELQNTLPNCKIVRVPFNRGK